jgi:hypothetical protein
MMRGNNYRIIACLEDQQPNKKLRTVMKMLAKKAVQILDTLKPDTIDDAKSFISALITNRSNPKERSSAG